MYRPRECILWCESLHVIVRHDPPKLQRSPCAAALNGHFCVAPVLGRVRAWHGSAMSYIVTKTIKGRCYRYLQTSYRVGRKVRTRSIYLGAASFGSTTTHDPKFDEEKELQRQRNEAVAYQAMLERFTREVGLKVGPDQPIPVDKPTSEISSVPTSGEEPGVPQEEYHYRTVRPCCIFCWRRTSTTAAGGQRQRRS
jgi:hypothetical protein